MRILVSTLILAVLFSCRQPNSPAPGANFTVNVASTSLRMTPGETGKVLRELPQGTVLYDLGSVSDFTTRVQLRGVWYDEPWLKVRTADGAEGWVYGGALRFGLDDYSAVAELLLEKRLQTTFGSALTDSVHAYRAAFDAIRSAEDFAAAFRMGNRLRDTMTQLMQDRIMIQNPEELPDMFWLQKAMPGLVPQLVAEGTAYYLFWNFAVLQSKAQATTTSAVDDEFVALNLKLFPEDSIEYFFPAWYMQTWDYGGSSLLGRGVHYQTLADIDQTLQKNDLFAPELLRLKTRLLNDITGSDVSYWEKQEAILIEVDSIINANFKVLTNADRIALQTRRQQFAAPENFGIQVNMQTGNYE